MTAFAIVALAAVGVGVLALSLGTLSCAIKKGSENMSAATDRLTHSLMALSSSVGALLAKPVPTNDAELTAAADQVDALKAKVDAAVSETIPAPAPTA